MKVYDNDFFIRSGFYELVNEAQMLYDGIESGCKDGGGCVECGKCSLAHAFNESSNVFIECLKEYQEKKAKWLKKSASTS